MNDRVLVTGASGFIAKQCIVELLQASFRVRGTVRSLRSKASVERAISSTGQNGSEIELVEADLTRDDGWSAACQDCRYVLHVASPFPSKEPRRPDDLIAPARDGTRRVLTAAANAGVERIVVTSSIVAIMQSARPDDIPRTEVDWTDLTNPSLSSYARSKTEAERAAWQMMSELGQSCFQSGSHSSVMSLSVINPGLVLGPILDQDLSTSHVLLRLLGRGTYPAIPKVAFPIVDVRDVARQHVVQLTHPAAANERWLCCNQTLSMRQIGEVMARTLPDIARKIPRIEIPSGLVRIGALFDRNLAAIVPELGRANLSDNSKSVARLGMIYRSSEEAVQTATESLRVWRMI